MKGTLYLLPCSITAGSALATLPSATIAVAHQVQYFLVENAKTARAFFKEIEHPQVIAQLKIIEIGHRPDQTALDNWLEPINQGADAALVSEAGCPAVADPGAEVVRRAHELGISVKPLVGPSALLLTLMASGLNGQRFRFVGYLPQDSAELVAAIRQLEAASVSKQELRGRDNLNGESQLFIETPYRNQKLFETLLSTCRPQTLLTVGIDLTGEELILTRSIAAWRRVEPDKRPNLQRRPTVFALLATA